MRKDGDILLELIGLSSDNEKAIKTLIDWNIYPTQKKDGTIAFTSTQYGQKSDYSVLLEISAKKIDNIRVWNIDVKTSLEMPFGLERTFNQQKLTNYLKEKKFVIKEQEEAILDFYTENGNAIGIFTNGEYIDYKDMSKEQLKIVLDKKQLILNKNVTAFTKYEDRYIMLSLEYELENSPTFISGYVINEIKEQNFKKYFKKEYELLTSAKVDNIKLETGKTGKTGKIGKIGAIINYLNTLELDFIHPYTQYIDFKQGDVEIISDCEKLIKTGALKAKLMDVTYKENPIGYEIFIYYKNEKTKIKYNETRYKSTTINALNKIFKNDYQMRLVTTTKGNDTLGFLTLSINEWKQLEVEVGKNKIADFFEFTTEILY